MVVASKKHALLYFFFFSASIIATNAYAAVPSQTPNITSFTDVKELLPLVEQSNNPQRALTLYQSLFNQIITKLWSPFQYMALQGLHQSIKRYHIKTSPNSS